MKLYIAGPMTGKPYFNFHAFDETAVFLRHLGYEVVSPAELDDPETRKASLESFDGQMQDGEHNGQTWGDFLARDVKLIADDGIEGIVCLEGWEESRGARLETFVGRLKGLPLYTIDPKTGCLKPVAESAIQKAHGTTLPPLRFESSHAAPRRTYTLKPFGGEPPMLVGKGLTMEWTNTIQPPKNVTRVVNEKTGGEKDAKTATLGDLCPKALMAVATVAGFGRRKYSRLNYLKGYAWSLSYDAMQRHLHAFWGREDTDPESGLLHLAHATWHGLCLLAFHLRGLGEDDRP